jgi:putative tryptophan/tyrosine transport system substrate-binding protein
VPGIRRIGVLWNDARYDGLVMPAVEAAARSLAVELRPVAFRTADELDTSFAAMTDAGAEAVLALPSSMSVNNGPRLATLALEHHLPNLFGWRTEVGCLLSYGADLNAEFQRCAVSVDKIIKGATPSEYQWSNYPFSYSA